MAKNWSNESIQSRLPNAQLHCPRNLYNRIYIFSLVHPINTFEQKLFLILFNSRNRNEIQQKGGRCVRVEKIEQQQHGSGCVSSLRMYKKALAATAHCLDIQ
jgi:hypothetical protein